MHFETCALWHHLKLHDFVIDLGEAVWCQKHFTAGGDSSVHQLQAVISDWVAGPYNGHSAFGLNGSRNRAENDRVLI